MKVSELIEQLSKLDPNLDVAIGYDCCMIADITRLQLAELKDDGEYDTDSSIRPNTVVLWDFLPDYEENKK